MFWLTIVSSTYQAIEGTPKMTVLSSGVLKRGFTLASTGGSAPWTDMLRAVFVSGRMVVSVEATAEVSTAMIKNLSRALPCTSVPSEAKMSSACSARPAYAGPAGAGEATPITTLDAMPRAPVLRPLSYWVRASGGHAFHGSSLLSVVMLPGQHG